MQLRAISPEAEVNQDFLSTETAEFDFTIDSFLLTAGGPGRGLCEGIDV